MAKIIDSKVTLELSHEELRALLKLIGNTSRTQRITELALSIKENDSVANFYRDLHRHEK